MSLVHRLSVAIIAFAALFAFAPSGSAVADEIAYNCSEDICVVNPDQPEEKADLTNTNSGNEQYPVWSPLGDLIAYDGYYPVPLNETWDVYTLDPAEAVPRSATDVSQTSEFNEETEYPNWSPDGTRIAFGSRPRSSSNPLGTEAYVGRADGAAAPTPIGSSTANESEPYFSPDGATVAFLRNASAVWTAPADGSGSPTQLGIAAYGVNWSPDGRSFAGVSFGATDQVEVTALDGSGTHALPAPVTINTETIDWSCDSTRLAYVADEEPLDHVRVVPADGSGSGVQIPLPAGWIVPRAPRFSPDGTRVAFSARPSSGNTTEQIVVAAADGSGVAMPVTKESGAGNNQPAWKPGAACGGTVQPPVSPPSTPGGSPGGGSGGSAGSGGAGSGGGAKGGGSRKPVKVLLSFFNHPTLDPTHMRVVGIDCHAQGGHPTGEVAEICAAAGKAYTSGSISTSSSLPLSRATGSKSSKVLFAKGAVRVPEGKKKTLALKITKAGQKLLATGKPISLKVTVTVKHGSAKAETKTKTVTVQRPRHAR